LETTAPLLSVTFPRSDVRGDCAITRAAFTNSMIPKTLLRNKGILALL
jgi:hypothetical protein